MRALMLPQVRHLIMCQAGLRCVDGSQRREAERIVKFCVDGMKRSSKLRIRDGGGKTQPLDGGAPTDLHVSSELSPVSPSTWAGMDAAARIAALGKAFQGSNEPGSVASATGGRWGELAEEIRGEHRPALKTLFGLLVVVAGCWVPGRGLLAA